MSTSFWTQVSRLSLVIALVGVVMAAWPLVDCTRTVADLLFSPAYADLDPGLLAMADEARGDLTEETAPKGVSRWSLTAPACAAGLPISDYGPGAGLFLFGLFGFFVGRRGDATRPEVVGEIDRDRLDELQRDATLARPKPLSADADVKPIEIDVDESELGIGTEPPLDTSEAHLYEDDADSLMAFVEAKRAADSSDEMPEAGEIDGFYCPPGYGNKPVSYVDPEHPEATDDLSNDAAFDNRERPFKTLSGALDHARRRIVTDVPGVMIRLMPGVYQDQADIPDRVVVVNHRTPSEGGDSARLRWTTSLAVGHPDAVTILAPTGAEHAVRFAPGRNHGIVGCHIVAREGQKQTGIVADGATALAILYCVIEGFEAGGMRLTHAGKDGPGNAVQIRGCAIRDNEAEKGGGILMQRSVVKLHACVVSENRAKSGGGVFAEDVAASSIVQTRFSGNLAEARPNGTATPEKTDLAVWGQSQGLGGALALLRSKIQVHRSEFVDNGASLGGGGIAVVHGRLLVNGDDELRVRVARNKSRVGGGIIGVGLRSGRTVLRLDDIDIRGNVARAAGGGLAVIGLVEAKVSDALFEGNRAEEKGAWGGGVSVHHGGKFLSTRTSLVKNRSAGCGGGFCVINGSVKLGEKSDCTENVARRDGGAGYVITKSSPLIESMVAANEVQIPFVFDIDKARIRRNASKGPGGGIRAGNVIDTPTPALGIKLNPARIRSNVTKSENTASADLWIEWAGEIKASALTTPERKFLLK